jgi:hypothetical protein
MNQPIEVLNQIKLMMHSLLAYVNARSDNETLYKPLIIPIMDVNYFLEKLTLLLTVEGLIPPPEEEARIPNPVKDRAFLNQLNGTPPVPQNRESLWPPLESSKSKEMMAGRDFDPNSLPSDPFKHQEVELDLSKADPLKSKYVRTMKEIDKNEKWGILPQEEEEYPSKNIDLTDGKQHHGVITGAKHMGLIYEIAKTLVQLYPDCEIHPSSVDGVGQVEFTSSKLGCVTMNIFQDRIVCDAINENEKFNEDENIDPAALASHAKVFMAIEGRQSPDWWRNFYNPNELKFWDDLTNGR